MWIVGAKGERNCALLRLTKEPVRRHTLATSRSPQMATHHELSSRPPFAFYLSLPTRSSLATQSLPLPALLPSSNSLFPESCAFSSPPFPSGSPRFLP